MLCENITTLYNNLQQEHVLIANDIVSVVNNFTALRESSARQTQPHQCK